MDETPQDNMTRPLGPYILTRPLGTGKTGKVWLATKVDDGRQVAIKIIKKAQFADKPLLQLKIQREISLMRLVNHPHILKFLDTLESPGHLYIVLEYASHGELFDYLVARQKLEEELAMNFFRQLIYGLEYLHNLRIFHRDLKPENLLLDEHLNLKIADFGFARFAKNNMADTACGSPHYVAPEVIRGDTYDGRVADIWSCGVILYALLGGTLPFDDQNIRTLLEKVKVGHYQMPPFPPRIQDLISRMLWLDPKERITISQIKTHPAFRYGLPDAYVIPTPLPLICGEQGIDPATISPEIVDLIHRIGYNDQEELRQDFLSAEPTMAKIFYMMLTSRGSLDEIRWDLSVDENVSESQMPQQAFLVAPNQQAFILGQEGDPFHRAPEIGSQSVEMSASYAAQTEWAVPSDNPILQVHIISCPGFQIVHAITAVQFLVRQFKMQWFYPDEYTIIARDEGIGLYVIIIANLFSENATTLEFQLWRGTLESFKTLCQAAEEYVSSLSGCSTLC